jgi:hypothetical protein
MTKLKTTHFERITSPLTGESWNLDMVGDFGFEVPEDLPADFKFVEFLTRDELVETFKRIEGLVSEELTDPEEYDDVCLAFEEYNENALVDDEYDFDEIDHGSAFLRAVEEEEE